MYTSIRPGQVWLDTEGKRIQAHGGSIFCENDTYYWYGENKEKTDGVSDIWHWGVRMYASHDLYNWEHYGFCQIYGETTFAADYKAARDDGIFRKNDANELLYLELVFRGVPLREDIPKEDRKILAPFLEPFENDLAEIYQMTEDDLREFDAQLEKYNGYPTFEACELYVENHPEILLEETEPD